MPWQELQGYSQRIRHIMQGLWQQFPSLRSQWQTNHDPKLLPMQSMQTQDVRIRSIKSGFEILCTLPYADRFQEIRAEERG